MTKTLTFIRHAESVANAGGVTMRHDAIPLSDLGYAQARKLAKMLTLAPSMVLISTFVRTRQTATPFCERFAMPPQECADLNEFSAIDPSLIEGLRGDERRPLMQAYWDEANPHRRNGGEADTLVEFASRVSAFAHSMSDLPDAAVIFGHGIWLAMLLWQLLGYSADDASGMQAFRRFQLGLPMPNCAVFRMTHGGGRHWSVQADQEIARRIAAVVR